MTTETNPIIWFDMNHLMVESQQDNYHQNV